MIDSLPESVRFNSVSSTIGSCAEADGIVTCGLGTLNSGENASVTIVVRARREGTISNTAQVSSFAPDPNQSNNADTEDTTVTQ